MAEYIEQAIATAIAEMVVKEHPYTKDPKNPDTYSQYNEGWTDACYFVRSMLEGHPAADVAPVIHAKWIPVGGGQHKCSHCHTVRSTDTARDHHCPNCGAKMDGA